MRMKPLFEQRMRDLLGSEFDEFVQACKIQPLRSIRCNTLKIKPAELAERLKARGWQIEQPFKSYREAIVVKSWLTPGELGKSIEHMLGYYYVQDLSSMMPPLVLNPKPYDIVLDMCAAPGSKTTQLASMMNNQGTIFANDVRIDRVSILVSNLEQQGVTNAIVTRHDGVELCEKLAKHGIEFDKVLVDAPCSGEGTIASSPQTLKMWNIKIIGRLAKKQKRLLAGAINATKPGGTVVYSTCTHAPEENEAIVKFALENFNIKLIPFEIPLKSRPGLDEWQGAHYGNEMKLTKRIYHHETLSEGFFIAKFKKIS